MSVCDTSRHQPTQQRNTVRLAWQRILALHTLIHNMNYRHNPQGPNAICTSFTSSFSLSLFTSFCHFLCIFLTSLQSFLFFGCLISFSFPPLCSFSVDVWRVLQPRRDWDWSYPGQGPLCVCGSCVCVCGEGGEGSLSGGGKDGQCVWMLGEEGLPLIE